MILNLLILQPRRRVIHPTRLSRITRMRMNNRIQRPNHLLRIINSSRSHSLILRLISRLLSTHNHSQVRHQNQLIRRRRLQVNHRHTHSTRTLLLTAKRIRHRIIRTILSLIPRHHISRHLLSLLRRLQTLISTTRTRTMNSILRSQLQRKIQLLRSRQRTRPSLSKISIQPRRISIIQRRTSLTLMTITQMRIIRPIRATRRNTLTTAKQPSRHNSTPIMSQRISHLRHLLLTMMRIRITHFNLSQRHQRIKLKNFNHRNLKIPIQIAA